MDVRIERHVDASDPDANGAHDYFYEYDLYRFSDGTASYFARSYTDTPEEAHFLKHARGNRERLLRPSDHDDPLFQDAVTWLRSAGKSELKVLSPTEGYIALNASS